MRNEIVRAITGDGLIQAAAVTGRDIVERARNIHTTTPVATAALGRALMGASLMGDALKAEEGSLTLQIKGGGPIGTVLAVSDNHGNVRGYVTEPHLELMEIEPGKLDVGKAVGETGTLTVIKDLNMKEPYVGSIGMFTGEIADGLAMYFVESEQIPTVCALGVLVDTDQSVAAAGGYLIQLLPGADLDMIEKIEAGVRRVGSVSKALMGGLDAAALRQQSHRPQDFYGQPHFMPSATDGRTVLLLNWLRTLARHTELKAVAAMPERTDLLQALNRLSSYLYILMIQEKCK